MPSSPHFRSRYSADDTSPFLPENQPPPVAKSSSSQLVRCCKCCCGTPKRVLVNACLILVLYMAIHNTHILPILWKSSKHHAWVMLRGGQKWISVKQQIRENRKAGIHPEVTCPHQVTLLGHWQVCAPGKFRQHHHRFFWQKQPQGCLIYSSLKPNGYQVEESLKELVASDCEVHVFDPLASKNSNGQNATNATIALPAQEGIEVHPWGFTSSKKRPNQESGSLQLDLKSLRETKELLGHAHRVVDLFLLDCEGCEWAILYDPDFRFLARRINQLVVEIHGDTIPKDFFPRMQRHDYVMFAQQDREAAVQDISFVKRRKEFLIP